MPPDVGTSNLSDQYVLSNSYACSVLDNMSNIHVILAVICVCSYVNIQTLFHNIRTLPMLGYVYQWLVVDLICV